MMFPHADYLTNEEINYELILRNYREDIGKDDQTKLRLLRRLFQTDQKDGRDYRSPYRFEQEVDIITNRVRQIQQAWLEKEGDPGLVSRLRHYYLRVRRGKTLDKEVEKIRKELLRSISDMLRSNTEHCSGDEASNTGTKRKTATQVNNSSEKTLGEEGSTTEPNLDDRSQPTYEELLEKVRELKTTIKQLRSREAHDQKRQSQPRDETPKHEAIKSRHSEHVDIVGDNGELGGVVQNEIKHRTSRTYSSRRQANEYKSARDYLTNESDSDLEDGGHSNWPHPHQYRDRQADNSRNQNRSEGNRRYRRTPSDERFSTRASWASDGYHNRNSRQSRRIEHWKLSFSGDNRTASVENFLYKLKKIAVREGVSEQSLLRDIHLILEGQASDWFFTYVDEFEEWDDFEEKIRFRFGNPNQDQGIRQKIHERKQQRGESFSAFVSDIERLNKMLSKPLSRRRKFEVVWDNMRPHYRSKTSIIRVRDLDHLILLNHRIDAAESCFHSHQDTRNGEPRNQRNIHQVECASSQDETEEREDLDVVDAMVNQEGQRQSGRIQRNGIRHTNTTDQQQRNQTLINQCWNCRKPGHNWRDCKEPRSIFCYGCGELGRTIRSCQRCADSSRRWTGPRQGNH